jgi:Ca2+-binding EF-hand superfamily protein
MAVPTYRITTFLSLAARTVLLSLAFATVAEHTSTTQLFAAEAATTESQARRDPVTVSLIPMDLKAAQAVLRKHDLDDNGSLNESEWNRLSWSRDEIRRFDLNRDGNLQQLEITAKMADDRLDDGIVQMDSTLADRYMGQYDANRDGKLSLDELSNNTFSDQLEIYDKNSNDKLTHAELIRGLAWERRFRDELGIKGCDQGGAMKLINRGDKNGDRRIDRSELPQAGLKTSAMDFDRNADGELSVSELAERLAERRIQLGLTPSDQLAARGLLRRLDRDGDGIILAADLPSQPANSDLSDFDQNSDGEITELELERVFGNRRRELGYDDQDFERATTLVQRNDRDGNRTLSRSELVAGGSDRSSPLSADKLPLVDENQDGKLSVSELARYLKKTR